MNEMIIAEMSKNLKVKESQIQAVLNLLEEGNTIPFIARYRKEATGGLEEVTINEIQKVYQYEVDLRKRKDDVIRLIDEKGMLTEELKNAINKASKLVEVEDLYRPFKEKKKTKATEAVAMGLQGLADYIMKQDLHSDVKKEAVRYLNEQVPDVEFAITNALYILAEKISDNPELRKWCRGYIALNASLQCKAKKDAATKDERKTYEMYYEYKELLREIKPHRLLAINRAEKEKVLTTSMIYDEEVVCNHIKTVYLHTKNEEIAQLYDLAVKDSYKRLIKPSVEREIYASMFDDACKVAIDVFGKNAKQLLMQAPIKNKMVLGVDPAYRTGCKLAIVDSTGKFIAKEKIFPHEPQNQWAQSLATLRRIIQQYKIEIIAIGNGTASRETEKLVAEAIAAIDRPISYALVSEAGASVYSASEEARKEFPDFHVEERSAVSIARRIIDPLAELVKIDPKSIGVGQYQHDVNQKQLDEELTFVVTSAVNQVGVDLNTASSALLKYVSGITPSVADNIVKAREKEGEFKNRGALLSIPRLTEKVYQQAAGFLRVKDGNNALDATGIHPESYFLAEAIMNDYQIKASDLGSDDVKNKLAKLNKQKYIDELHVDEYTIDDVIKNLKAPNIDPRDSFDKPLLKSDVLHIEDLTPGMELEGTVRNLIDFGAFVDIGVKQDGLVHISKITKKYIKHPIDVLHVGQIVKVWVLSVDVARKRIQLTMIQPENS